jgi:hypothetical protein
MDFAFFGVLSNKNFSSCTQFYVSRLRQIFPYLLTHGLQCTGVEGVVRMLHLPLAASKSRFLFGVRAVGEDANGGTEGGMGFSPS